MELSLPLTYDHLLLIVNRDVDCLVLGGDLFHENKPSRATIVRCMDLLDKYVTNQFRAQADDGITLKDNVTNRSNGKTDDGCNDNNGTQKNGDGNYDGDNDSEGRQESDVRIKIINERAMEDAVGSSLPKINFHDKKSGVALPIFAIHGNHDDPTGPEHLSVMDMLSRSKLLTYFGKYDVEAEGPGKIQISPIVIQKGTAKLSLSGLGYIRDERLNRMFDTPNSVRFVKPEGVTSAVSTSSECFNLFMIHQNKQRVIQAKNYVSPRHLPEFLDLVCWGHEHECLITPQPDHHSNESFFISQPGSSVVTSLIEGEATRKKIMILSVRETEWSTEEITLEYTRPFMFKNIKFNRIPDLDPDDPSGVEDYLHSEIEQAIEDAENEREVPVETLKLPLVRLKVDYTGFSTINTQRFGQKYVGRVANPSDLIVFHKEAKRKATQDGRSAGTNEPLNGGDWGNIRPNMQMDHRKIDQLVRKNLTKPLNILPLSGLLNAVQDFVEKEENNAIGNFVKKSLEEARKVIETISTDEDDSDDDKIFRRVSESVRKKEEEAAAALDDPSPKRAADDVIPDSDYEGTNNDNEIGANPVVSMGQKQAAFRSDRKPQKRKLETEADSDDLPDISGRFASDKRTAPKRSKKTTGSKQRQRKAVPSKYSSEEYDEFDDGENVDSDWVSDSEEIPASTRRKVTRGSASMRRGQSTADQTTQRTGSRRTARPPMHLTKPLVVDGLISSDEED